MPTCTHVHACCMHTCPSLQTNTSIPACTHVHAGCMHTCACLHAHMLLPSAVEGPRVDRKDQKVVMLSPWVAGGPHDDRKCPTMVHAVTLGCGRTSRWQKDQKIVHTIVICSGRPHSDRKDGKWPIPSLSTAAYLTMTDTRKWSISPPSTAADLTVTERPENGPCHHHLPRETSQWQKGQEIVHAIAICSSRPHSDRKDQKMVNSTIIHCSWLYGGRKSKKWSLPQPSVAADLMVTKDQKMVHATAVRQGRAHGDRKTRTGSLPLPFAMADLTVTGRLESGPCHRHQPCQTSQWQKDQKMVHATAIHCGRPHSERKTR